MITKEQHRKIRSMTRHELDKYLSDIYIEGHNNGVAAMSAVLSKKIDKGIKNTPGVGEKRYQDIMKSITEELHKPDEPKGG